MLASEPGQSHSSHTRPFDKSQREPRTSMQRGGGIPACAQRSPQGAVSTCLGVPHARMVLRPFLGVSPASTCGLSLESTHGGTLISENSAAKVFEPHAQVCLIPRGQRSVIALALEKDSANSSDLRQGRLLFVVLHNGWRATSSPDSNAETHRKARLSVDIRVDRLGANHAYPSLTAVHAGNQVLE